MNLRDASGKQIGTVRGKLQPLAAGAGAWKEAVMLYEIPAQISGAEVKSAQFVVIVDGLQNGVAYVDDVSVYQASGGLKLESTFWNVLDYIRASEPQGGPVKQSVADTVYGSVYAAERSYAKLILDFADNRPSATANGSFETGTGASATPWSYWVRTTGSIARLTEASRTGQYGLLIQNMERGGPAQTVTAESGYFAAEAWYKVKEGTPPGGTIQLGLNLMDAAGKTLSTVLSDIRPLDAASVGTWRPVRLKGIIPASVGASEVKKAQLVVIADKAWNGTALYVDDVSLYMTPSGP
jgi:hypothetical protein